MKLGLWNRLAITLGVIGTFALPTWWALSTNANHSQVMGDGYRACMAAGSARADLAAADLCWEIWMGGRLGYIGWEQWWQAVAGAAVAMLVLYLIVLAAVSVAKWVWRGRAVTAE